MGNIAKGFFSKEEKHQDKGHDRKGDEQQFRKVFHEVCDQVTNDFCSIFTDSFIEFDLIGFKELCKIAISFCFRQGILVTEIIFRSFQSRSKSRICFRKSDDKVSAICFLTDVDIFIDPIRIWHIDHEGIEDKEEQGRGEDIHLYWRQVLDSFSVEISTG